jgi:hypothetical protein
VLFAGMAVILGSPARTARADGEAVPSTKPAIDLEYALFMGRALDDGAGGALRIGREFAGMLSLTPELGISYHCANGVHDASLYRGFIGPRLSIGKTIHGGVFGHLGYGRIAFRHVSGPLDQSHDALAYDGGLTVDVTLLPVLDVGAHAAYNGLASSHEHEGVHWLSVGGHVSVRFVDR